jgi:hypothetical protein
MLAVKLDIVVNDLSEMLDLYNRIEVHRSTTELGTYVELTDLSGPTSAVVDGTLSSWGVLSGLVLQLLLDGSPVSVTLPILDPMPLQSIIDAINEVANIASEVPTNTNRLRLTSSTHGTSSALEIITGTVATTLGLSTVKVNGKERRIRLTSPTTMYSFFDKDGDNTFWYKTRFSNTGNSNVSNFSDARQGNTDLIVPPSRLVKGTIDLVDGLGRPVVGRRIIFIPNFATAIATTTAWVIPGFDARVEVLTNEAGHASANLLRNITYKVVIEGTSFIREFTTPDSNTTFNILSIAGSSPDTFDIVQTPLRPIKMTI